MGSVERRIYLAADENGKIILGGPWALGEIKGDGVPTQRTVTDAPTKLLDANPNRKSALITNNRYAETTAVIWLSPGAAPADTSNCTPLPPGATLPDNITDGEWWAMCATDESADVRIIEVSTQ